MFNSTMPHEINNYFKLSDVIFDYHSKIFNIYVLHGAIVQR